MTSVYITGASAGLGRAIAEAFAKDDAKIGLIARDVDALRKTSNEIPNSVWASADVASYNELFHAAEKLEKSIGPPDIWINNAMATIFSRFDDIEPEEFSRAVNVTFMGSIYGLQIALKYMKARRQGHIIQIGSALAYRAIPLQAPYCASKLAIRGAVDSLRCELIHDKSPVKITMVHMPAMNTPQFDWARRHVAQNPQPVPPIYAPEACARAVLYASKKPHFREIWVGKPTLEAIIGNKLMPAFMDRYMAKNAYESQFENPAEEKDNIGNLFEPVSLFHNTKGRFNKREIEKVFWIGTSETREILLLACLLLLCLLIATTLIAL